MVVYHMVIFKYKPGTTPDQIAKFVKGAETLRTIPGTLAVRAGENFTDRAKGFQLGLLAILESKEALDIYQPHPLHVVFKAECITPIVEEIMASDFEGPAL